MRFILLYIRYRQLTRILKGLGFYIVITLLAFVLLIYTSNRIFIQETYAYYYLLFLILICLLIQYNRRDKKFLSLHVRNFRSEIFYEYVVLTFPFSISSLLSGVWYLYPVMLGILYLITFIDSTFIKKTPLKNISRFIPASNFEWISGIRKTFPALFVFYILALGFSWFKVLPLFFLWLVTTTICSFYKECEPENMLVEGAGQGRNFLKRKILLHSRHLFVIYIPVVAVNFIFNPEYGLLIFLFVLMQFTLLCFSIFLKYASYKPSLISEANSVLLAIVMISSLIPYLLPIPLLMALIYYNKAKLNLNYYLND